MVARVEDCFLGKEQGFGGSGQHKLLGPRSWGRWGVGGGGGRDGVDSGSSFYASRSGDLPTWTTHEEASSLVRLNAMIAVPESVTNESGILSSFVSSYLMAHAASAVQPTGRANSLAPGNTVALARNPSFESITSGSCSTPSFCDGTPPQVFRSRPSDAKEGVAAGLLTGSGEGTGLSTGGAASPPLSKVMQPQLSDHYLSTDSLSYEDRDAMIVAGGGGGDFWSNPHMVSEEALLPEFRFEPMLDDTAMSFELDSLVGTNHRTMVGQRGASLTSMIQPDFCQLFFDGHENEKPVTTKPTQLAIPPKSSSLLAALNSGADHHHHQGRLRWSDQPWSAGGATTPPPARQKSGASSPSSPTTPLDPHLFATQTPTATLREDEIRKKLTEFSSSSSNKRSFATMAEGSATLRVPAPNADKFDAAALSALLYNNNTEFRSTTTTTTAPHPAPKQRRRHGTATDPQSIAARTRREKFTDRIRVLQSLVPNGERLDTVHMLSQTFEYVRFLQHKVWDLYNGQDSLAEVKCEKWKEFVDSSTGQVIV